MNESGSKDYLIGDSHCISVFKDVGGGVIGQLMLMRRTEEV